MRCPEADCNHVSVTFEPFMNISLPIPTLTNIEKVFVWVPYAVSEKSSLHTFKIKSHESVRNLRKYLTSEILSQIGLCTNHN